MKFFYHITAAGHLTKINHGVTDAARGGLKLNLNGGGTFVRTWYAATRF